MSSRRILSLPHMNSYTTPSTTAILTDLLYTCNYVLLLVVAPEREMFNEVYTGILLCSVPLALGTENYTAITTSTALCSMFNVCTVQACLKEPHHLLYIIELSSHSCLYRQQNMASPTRVSIQLHETMPKGT